MYWLDIDRLGYDAKSIRYINTYRDPLEIVISGYYYLKGYFPFLNAMNMVKQNECVSDLLIAINEKKSHRL